jgi:hypothetical protein
MNWRNIREGDFFLLARSYHLAAKRLAGTLDLDGGPIADFDAGPVLSIYRRAVELHLKVLVLGDGGNFLPTKPDELSVHKTRSLSWLAQFVIKIVTTLKWEDELRAQGIEDLSQFMAAVEEVNAIDPSFHAFRLPVSTAAPRPGQGDVRRAVREFTDRADALIDLLASTADALAATWDLQRETAVPGVDLDHRDDFEPTIQ